METFLYLGIVWLLFLGGYLIGFAQGRKMERMDWVRWLIREADHFNVEAAAEEIVEFLKEIVK